METSHNTAKLAQHNKISPMSCVVEYFFVRTTVPTYKTTTYTTCTHVSTCILMEIQQNLQQHVEYFTEIQTFKLHGIKMEVQN